MTRERLPVWILLGSTFLIRAIHPGQPIVENYVGRQIPTAMVARNLERGSGFLHPQLDTGPFPNLFLVEPPVYAQLVVVVRAMIGLSLESTGRLVSAAATTLAAWGLYGLARRREGVTVALLTLASFGAFPVMIRYGRAFQPDALMLGCVLAGLFGWDEFEATGDRRWAAFGGFVLAAGLALKVTVAWALIPFLLIVRRWSFTWRVAASVAMLIPASTWYLHAWEGVATPGVGSLASFENANLWAKALSLEAWVRLSTYEAIGRGLVMRSFTPVGFVLGSVGWLVAGRIDRVWVGWGLGCLLSILGLASKWHHAYYWMVVAPVFAVGVARALACLMKKKRWGGPIAIGLGSFYVGLCAVQSASTWQTPDEWGSLVESAREVRGVVPDSKDDVLVASEALLYFADRRGARLELDAEATQRAAGEWGGSLTAGDDPLALVDFYRTKTTESRDGPGIPTARVLHVADVGRAAPGSRRAAIREALRASPRYVVLIDRPELILASSR